MDVPMDKPESFIPTFNMLFEPFHDRQRHFDASIGRESQMSVNQRLGKPDATAKIQQVEPCEVRSAYPPSQPPEQRFSGLLDTNRQHVRCVTLQVARNSNAIQACHCLNSSN